MTVTFGVNALAGRQEYRARTSSTGSDRGQGSGASAGQSISTRARFEPWPEIEAQLEQLVGGGADLSVSPGNASVTVTGTPARVDRVRGYLRHLNRTVLRPVNLSLHVYAVRIERDADYRIGIASLIDRVLGESVRVEIGSGRIAIVKPDGLPEGARTLNAALTALQSVGTASRVLSADVPSLNGMPAQFYELLKTAYLAEAEVTSTDSGTRTSLKPGQINSGFLVELHGPDHGAGRVAGALGGVPAGSATLHGVRYRDDQDSAAGIWRSGRAGDATVAARRDARGVGVQGSRGFREPYGHAP